MSSPHWSRTKSTLWWRDAGTGRMRVSFHDDRSKLAEKYKALYHEEIDAAMYDADGKRIPLSAPQADPPKKKRKPRQRKQEHGAEDVAVAVESA